MMKSGFTTLSKVLAICLSLGLLGGYVWWQSEVGKKEDDPDNESKGDVIMSGSKSKQVGTIRDFKELNGDPQNIEGRKPEPEEEPAFLPGPKSGGVSFEDIPELGRLFKKQEAKEPEPEEEQK